MKFISFKFSDNLTKESIVTFNIDSITHFEVFIPSDELPHGGNCYFNVKTNNPKLFHSVCADKESVIMLHGKLIQFLANDATALSINHLEHEIIIESY